MYFYTHCAVILFALVVYVTGISLPDRREPLSSAIMRESTIPKPTKYYNRATNLKDNTTNLDLSNASVRRISFADIWSWDYWCQLQPKIGNCSKSVMRYYYSTQLDQCVNFTYSGCGANSNTFDTELNCELYCNGAIYMSLKDEVPNFCLIQPDAGMCLSLIEKYYYDANNSDCKKFQYGGCGGNRNRFDTKQFCRRECKGS